MKRELKLVSDKCLCTGSYACEETTCHDGRIYIIPGTSDGDLMLKSDDGAMTWKTEKMEGKHIRGRFIELEDGSYISLNGSNVAARFIADARQKNMPFIMAVYRAKSYDDILAGKIETSFVNIDIPDLCGGMGDSDNFFVGFGNSTPRVLSNGDLYYTMYGTFNADTTLCPYFQEYGKYDFYLYRTWSVVSHDMGKTFEYVTTIADVQTYPIPDINAEGYCESDVIEVEDGHLVCILRTGGHEVYSPLYCAHSYDYGKTWGAPYVINDWGVLPKLFKMQDGTLVIVSGHIHTMLLFSDDGGLTWSEPFIVEPCDGKWDKSPSGYNCVFEPKPGLLSIIFDDPKAGIAENAGEGKLRRIYSRIYEVT